MKPLQYFLNKYKYKSMHVALMLLFVFGGLLLWASMRSFCYRVAFCEFHSLKNEWLEPGSKLTRLDTGEIFEADGPVWNNDNSVYFRAGSDASLYQYRIRENLVERMDGGGSGLRGLFMRGEDILACNSKVGQIVRIDQLGKSVGEVSTGFLSQRFNQPNDMVADQHGGIYFTDPSWSAVDVRAQRAKGVYYINGAGQTSLLIHDMDKPNGIALSPEGKTLYVGDMGSDELRQYAVLAPGKLGEFRRFAEFYGLDRSSVQPDGMRTDSAGNLYVATRRAVEVFNSAGDFLGMIDIPARPYHIAFYGSENNTLFIAADRGIYSIPLKVNGAIAHD